MGGRDHLLGIGGVGMSALAQALIDAGRTVTGADRLVDGGGTTPVLEALRRQGVELYPETGAGIDAGTDRVIVSTAIEDANPGLMCARELGVSVVHRAPALAEALSGRRLVAVAGTCGKSTVTAILGHLLVASGFDPVVVNGAQIVGWDDGGRRVGSVRKGGGEWAVAEVDESDKSLTAFRPYAAIVTNASADHYSEEEMNAVFDAFVKDVPGPVIDGRVLLNGFNGLSGFKDFNGLKGFSGFKDFNGLKGLNGINGLNGFGDLMAMAEKCPLPGAHNRANAFLALCMAAALGAPTDRLAAALETFPGVERRLQRVGACAGAVVYDDYAHNPEKLAAMWRTLADAYPKGVAVLWRPHGYGPLRKMMDALAAMFAQMKRPQDELVLLPVYDAGGTADRSVNTDALAARVSGARMASDLNEAETVLRKLAPAVGAIVTAGARDPGLPVLARRLAEKE